MFNRLVKYFLDNRLITFIFFTIFVVCGIVFAPFNWKTGIFPVILYPWMQYRILVKISRLLPPNGWDVHPKIFRTR